jgi:hypothetical protein
MSPLDVAIPSDAAQVLVAGGPCTTPAPALCAPAQLQSAKPHLVRGDSEYYRALAKRPRRPRVSKKAVQHATAALQPLMKGKPLKLSTSEGKLLEGFRVDLTEALGGKGCISPQQLALVELAACSKLLLHLVDRELTSLDSLMHRGKRALWPVVLQRQTLADGLLRTLQALGLERRAKPVENLHDYLRRTSNSAASQTQGAPVPSDPVVVKVAEPNRAGDKQ